MSGKVYVCMGKVLEKFTAFFDQSEKGKKACVVKE